MWFRTLFDSLERGRAGTPARRGGGRPRPAAGRLAVERLGDRIVPASLSVGDAVLVEGHAGTPYAAVSVTLDAPTNKTVTVNYGTADGTAVAGSDYAAVSGTLSFAPGQTSKTILVPVTGDRFGEGAENFVVKLRAAKNAKVADGTGVVTVVDDEPRLGISDAVVEEGNAGTTLMTFTVSLWAAYDQAVSVNYATADGSAIAGEDYLAAFGTLTFAPGETTKTITVEVVGDATPEGTDLFFVNLSGGTANLSVDDGQGYGWIQDDDGWYPEPDPGPCTENCGVDGPGDPYPVAP
jgi:hypothetical protein